MTNDVDTKSTQATQQAETCVAVKNGKEKLRRGFPNVALLWHILMGAIHVVLQRVVTSKGRINNALPISAIST